MCPCLKEQRSTRSLSEKPCAINPVLRHKAPKAQGRDAQRWARSRHGSRAGGSCWVPVREGRGQKDRKWDGQSWELQNRDRVPHDVEIVSFFCAALCSL